MDATRFVEEIVTLGVASREQIDAAAQQPSTWRTLPARLVEFGYDRADVLSAVSVAVGLPPAPPAILRAAFAPSTGVSVDAWRSVIACPVLASDGVVLLTTSVEAVGQAQSWGVNPARVFAVLEPDVEDVLVAAEALGVNPGVVVHDAMGQIELASADAGVDVIGLPGAPVDVGSLGSSASLELDLEGRSARAPAFGGVEGAPAAAASDVVVSAVANRDPTTGSLAALSDDSGDDSALEGAAAAGQQLCGHDIYEELGRGASAVVFRARRPGESYDVALKIITKETARNPAFPQRFKREIRAQASLTHANIVRVIDYGREDGWYFLATEYLPGGTLEDLVAESGPLPGAVAVCVLDEVLRGIAFAQTRGVVHRDLKPGNLLLGADGRIKIGDFGLARMDLDPNKSSFGTVQGTPAYMSPEQALGLDIDGRSDLFTLATIVYELVTGTNPYRRELGPATLMAVAQAKSLSLFDVLPNVPLELDEAVHRMSHKETERRPASADEVLAILAPAVEMTRRRWPDLLPTYLRAPLDTATRLNAQLADEEVARARAILASDDEKLRASAALAIGRALTHRPDHAEAHAMWAQLVEAGFSGGDALKPDLIAVEQQLADAPDDPRLLRRASELARGEGNVLKQAAYLRRYLRLGQKDTLAVHQLSLLLSSDATVPVPAPALAAGRIATPATSPMASSPGFPVAPSASSAALPIQEAPSPSAPPAQAIPSARAPRVVGTGAETQSISTPRPSRGGLAALLGVVLLGCVLVAAWFLLADDVKGMIEGAAEEQVEERIDENTGAGPRVVNPFEQRQRGTLREARAHVSAGRLDEAIDAFTTAIDIDPGSTQAMQGWLGRADAYARRGDKETATKQYQRVLELTSEGAFGHAEAKAALKALGSPVGE